MNNRRIPFCAVLLIILLILQAVSALFGGIMLLADPSGNLLEIPAVWLKGSPFNDFLVPGIVLSLILGVLPGFTAYSLIFRPRCKWAGLLNIYKDKYFAWTFALYIGIMLNIWITVQICTIGYGHIFQTIYSFVGILITILSLVPAVMNYYLYKESPSTDKWRTL